MNDPNKTPEQIARDRIDQMLHDAGLSVQDKNQIDFDKSSGIAVREYPTDSGPADYVLFAHRKPVGVIEAKRPEMAQNINVVAEQSAKYATAKLKWIKDNNPLPLLYESTGEFTLFRDERDLRPISREVFWFHQPQTLHEWMQQPQTLRARLQKLPSLATHGLRKVQIQAITSLEKFFKAGRPRADLFRQSILKKAFSGRLVSQDPNNEPASELLKRMQAEKKKSAQAQIRATGRSPRSPRRRHK